MSLLNQVLRDLEQDKVATNSNNTNIFSQVKPSSPTKSNNVVILIVVTVLLIVTTFIAYQYALPTNAEKQALPEIKPLVTVNATTKNSLSIETVEVGLVEPFPAEPDLAESVPIEPLSPEPALVEFTPVEPVLAEPTPTRPILAEVAPIKSIPEKIVVKKIDNIKPKSNTTPTIIVEEETKVAPSPAKKITSLSPEQKADRLFSKAKKTLSLFEKQKLLQQVLVLNPEHIEAHLLIAHSYLQRGLMNDSIQSLKESLHSLPNNIALTKALAGLLLKNKQEKEALERLLDINTQTVKDERFLTLLAAAYQQNKLAVKAADSYQQLLDINPDKAEYWLGLAVSLEGQKRNNDALVAYRRALALNSLKPAVVNYIKQRINSIN